MAERSKTPTISRPRLAVLGDFGGTNVRLGLAEIGQPGARPAIRNVTHFHSKDFRCPTDAVTAYLSKESVKAGTIVVATAGPVTDGRVAFTNLGWSFSESDLKAVGFSAARIVNDFVALALSAPLLGESDVHRIGAAVPNASQNICVMGPGTGFGASALVVERGGRRLPLAAEGGHASFAPEDDVEIQVLRFLSRRMEHVSIERILSGPGLVNLHTALNAIEGVNDTTADSEDLTQRALAGEQLCLRTLERFCAILGSTAGNLALTYGAQGGLYIAGGIAPAITNILDRSEFRQRFETKGRFVAYLRPIATQVIVRPDATFLGAAHIAQEISD